MTVPSPELPPRAAVAVYESKPLPQLPARALRVSSFSVEVNTALETPKRSVDYSDNDFDWEKEEASIDVSLERDVRWLPHIGGTDIPSTPPDGILSAQARQSVRKILGLTSGTHQTPSNPSPTSPTGHNSSQKVRQLMGIDVATHGGYVAHEDMPPVSPLSGSSVYSTDMVTTVSEPDDAEPYTDVYHGYYSDPERATAANGTSSQSTPWAAESWADVPPSLRIGRQAGKRHSDPPVSPLSPIRPPSGQFLSGHGHRRLGSKDYHAAITTSSVLSGTPPAGNDVPCPIAYPRSPIGATAFDANLPRKPSFSDRMANSHVRMAPVPSRLRTVSSNEGQFGTGKHPLRTPYPRGAAPAAATSKSAFDDDDDDDDSGSSMWRRSGILLQVFGSRKSDDVVEIRSPSVLPEEHRRQVRTGSDDSTVQEKMVITNRSRRADGPDTPFPPFARTAANLVAQARSGVGIKSRSDRRREELKSRIRVISEGETERAAAEKGRKGGKEREREKDRTRF